MSATICLPLWKVDHTRPPRIFLNSPAHRKPGRPWCWEVLEVSGVRLKSKHIFCQIFVFLGWILTDISLWDLLVFKAKSFLFVMSSLTFDRNLRAFQDQCGSQHPETWKSFDFQDSFGLQSCHSSIGLQRSCDKSPHSE